MAKLNHLLDNLKTVADNPKTMLQKYLADGKKVIGCFPIYTPAEMIHAAGMIPMGIWGGQVNPSLAGQYAPIFICSIMRSALEFGMLGKYEGLSAVVMPILCDTFRGMSGAWRAGVKNIPLLGVIQPQNREVKGAVDFLAAEYAELKINLEKIAGQPVTDAALAKSIELYNAHSAMMLEFAQTANKHLDIITPKIRHAVMKSAHFMEKGEHLALVREIVAELNNLPEHNWTGKKVILTGITAEPDDLLEMLQEEGIAVVGDDLAQESRQYRTLIPANGAPLTRLAQQWDRRKACSVVHEVENSRAQMLTEMAQATNADGVIVCLMSFCDVEEYEYSMIAQHVEAAGLKCLCLDIDQSTENSGQSRTKIQTFVEML
ncbi:MAG: 2-hydroxyacyl-CoA dehydratase family protein [Sporomusaceae bacterium]|jgi:benzoyl-CoA reductase/2-hydroxyglutaryl-CoA dehydratase subunit BcrC/BadD/HgdB|nr:2-hydroxyacyl-CoA dehydratase family protein [Sporomusaceae bacterium]